MEFAAPDPGGLVAPDPWRRAVLRVAEGVGSACSREQASMFAAGGATGGGARPCRAPPRAPGRGPAPGPRRRDERRAGCRGLAVVNSDGADDPVDARLTSRPSLAPGPDGASFVAPAPSGDGRRPAALPVTPNPPAVLDGDLLDRVIQRIFVAGLLLHGAADGSPPTAAVSIEQAIGELDEVLRDIRATAFTALAPENDAGELRSASNDLDVAVEKAR